MKNVVPPDLREYWMSLEEAAEELRLTKSTISRKIGDGVFEKIKHGRHVLVSRQSVNRYMDMYRHVARESLERQRAVRYEKLPYLASDEIREKIRGSLDRTIEELQRIRDFFS